MRDLRAKLEPVRLVSRNKKFLSNDLCISDASSSATPSDSQQSVGLSIADSRNKRVSADSQAYCGLFKRPKLEKTLIQGDLVKPTPLKAVMGRKSKGNTHNESKNLEKWLTMDHFLMKSPYKSSKISSCVPVMPLKPVEILRSTPVPTSAMPKTFAEAALLASQKTQDRCLLRSADAGTPGTPSLYDNELRPKNLDYQLVSFCSTASEGSRPSSGSCSSSEGSLVPLPAIEEGDVSVQLLALTIGSPAPPQNDSFCSDPGSQFNRGAMDFLQLVEDAVKKADQVKFSDLLVQMMDLQVGEKIATPDHIADSLNRQGWHAGQVSSVWNVSSQVNDSKEWDIGLLKHLGGNNVLIDTWSKLKEGFHTGFPKRAAPEQAVGTCKKFRRSPVLSSDKVGTISKESTSNSDFPVNVLNEGSRHHPSQNLNVPLVDSKQRSRRRTAAAKRSLGAKEKITWWLSNQQTPSKTPAPEDAAPSRHLSTGSPDMFLNTPESKPPGSHLKKRRRRTRKKKTPSTPNLILPSSSTPTSQDPASPSLNQRKMGSRPPSLARRHSQQEEKTTIGWQESSGSGHTGS